MARSEEIDALMMGYLYGELSEDEASAFQSKLAENPDLETELAGHRRMREAFGQLESEEPPPSITAQLLHEAAKRAPAKKRPHAVEERPGFWERLRMWFQPIMAHPAAASVAALLLVGGVAGLFYVRGVDAPVGPRVETDAPAPGAAAAPTGGLAFETGAPGTDVTLEEPGYFRRNDKIAADGLERDSNLDIESKPAAGTVALGDNKNRDSFDARLARPEQERALREQKDQAKEGQVYSVAPSKKQDSARRNKAPVAGKRGGRGEDLPLANAVSGADPLIVPEYAESEPSDGRAVRGGDAGGERAMNDPVATTEKTTGSTSTWDRAPARKGKSSTKSVARQAPARDEPAPPPAPQAAKPGASFDADDDLGVADEEVSDYGSMAQRTTSQPSQTNQNKRDSYRVYKDKRADSEAKSLHGKLNRALDGKKRAKNKRCREAARIANDILDRNPEYYRSKVEGSKRMKPCNWYVANETRSRRSKRARKAAKKATGKAAPAELDSADTAATSAE